MPLLLPELLQFANTWSSRLRWQTGPAARTAATALMIENLNKALRRQATAPADSCRRSK